MTPRLGRLVISLAGCTAVVAALSACGRSDSDADPVSLNVTVNVFAASSLTEAFARIEAAYESEYPATDVVINFAGSSALAAQIREGAPADVFASADLATLEAAIAVGDVAGPPQVFATNTLAIAVELGNPKNIRNLSDLATPELIVVLADTTVPAGKYAAEVLAVAGVSVTPASLEQNVRAVLSKVALGEADAGIVYRTDLASESNAQAVDIPTDQNVVAEYAIGSVTSSDDRPGDAAATAKFIDFVLGPAGRSTLEAAGFGLP